MAAEEAARIRAILQSPSYALADDQLFKREVENLGIECIIIQYGDEIEV